LEVGLKGGRLKPGPQAKFFAFGADLNDDRIGPYLKTADAHAHIAGKHITFFADFEGVIVDNGQAMIEGPEKPLSRISRLKTG